MEDEGQLSCHTLKSDSPSENSFTIIWEIENSKYFYQVGHKMQSPVVFVDVMEKTCWSLVLYRMPPEKYIYVIVKREKDQGPKQYDLYYDFDITCSEDGILKSTPHSHVFRKNESGPPILVSIDKLGKRSCENFLPHNTIIRCIMKKNNGPISMSGQCIARTRIEGEYFRFIGRVENFGSLSRDDKKTLKILSSSSTNERLLTLDLRVVSGVPYPMLDIIPTGENSEYKYIFFYTILECSGHTTKYRKSCEYTLRRSETLEMYPYLTDLITHADYYLPNDTLNLLCEIVILTGIKSEEIENIEYGTVSVEDVNKNTSSYLKGLPHIIKDLAAFYNKGILCDVKLQTTAETFPAHKAILSARSPVFEAMFTSDMKEKTEECVSIDDVEAETMKRMLFFLYSDFLEELKWEDAKKLYFAADKYQVLPLKHRCSVILKKNIDFSNCCELLLLADMHQDKELKVAVKNCIAKYEKRVFRSEQWMNMEKSHPHLTTEILRAVYI